jgi:hypothetical protein
VPVAPAAKAEAISAVVPEAVKPKVEKAEKLVAKAVKTGKAKELVR